MVYGDQARERIDKKCRNQKARNELREFRWGTFADHPHVISLHPALSCANNAGESGRMTCQPSCPADPGMPLMAKGEIPIGNSPSYYP
jgi:hypothetical protein